MELRRTLAQKFAAQNLPRATTHAGSTRPVAWDATMPTRYAWGIAMAEDDHRFICCVCNRPVLEWVQIRDGMICCSCAAELIAELRWKLGQKTGVVCGSQQNVSENR